MVTLKTNHFTEAIKQLAQPPRQLYASNERFDALMQKPRIAIVGSRKVSAYGRSVTHSLALKLASRGIVIVSGLALGVDSIAHGAALEAKGETIAVLPCGLDRIYPRSHTDLARRIHQSGLLLTEYAAGTEPFKHHFIARNRLIAACADAVLITEAALKSGSLHTAHFALDLGIPVLAVPGNITSQLSEGCNNLIKAGAVPITNTEDIYSVLGWQPGQPMQQELIAGTPEEQAILDLLRQGIQDGHELLTQSKLPASSFNQALTMLELTGRVRSLGANQWTLA